MTTTPRGAKMFNGPENGQRAVKPSRLTYDCSMIGGEPTPEPTNQTVVVGASDCQGYNLTAQDVPR